jgi:ABC-type dipeptide/oligopeptide/nickel transport system ATPase component
MYAGRIVEDSQLQLATAPLHPYTQSLATVPI